MPPDIMLVVLFAALLHAAWNALIKSSPDKFLDIVLVTTVAAVLSGVLLSLLPLPHAASWPYIAASVVIHIAYFLLIGASYRNGDMSHTYPLMRGAPPLLVALASGPLIGEYLSHGQWVGIVLVCGGIVGLLLIDGRSDRFMSRATRLALVNAVAIAAYTLVDGTGVRLSGNAIAYTAWMFVLTGPPILVWALRHRCADMAAHLSRRWHLGVIGGACTLGAYILVLWAMTQAPVALVAALRETAIVFGTAISAFVLKERMGWSRPISASIILLGVLSIRLA